MQVVWICRQMDLDIEFQIVRTKNTRRPEMTQERINNNTFGRTSVGSKVENFTMATYEPEKGTFGEFKLDEQLAAKRWTVLFFYPADFTFVCPTELADLAAKHAELKEMGVDVVSVSTDTQYVHLGWTKDEKLLKNVAYTMAADPTGEVSRMFGVYDDATGLALRGTFIINPDGVLVGSETNFYNVGRNADELLRKMKAYLYVFKNPSEACPAKWDEGQTTLKPGEALVGKVAQALGLG